MKAKNIIQAICFISISFLTAAALSSEIGPGDIPYDHVGLTANKEKIKISQFKGKVVILTFWATWCPPCMKELPVLSGIQKKAGLDNIQIIAVNYRESKKMFQSVSEALKDNPIIITHDKRGRIGKKYGVSAIPHMVIIGADGLVLAVHLGYGEDKLPSLVREINLAIAESKK